jgi:hypothetical protein
MEKQYNNLNSSAIRSIVVKSEDIVLVQFQSSDKEYAYSTDSIAFIELLDQESSKSEPSFGRLINCSVKDGTLELIES